MGKITGDTDIIDNSIFNFMNNKIKNYDICHYEK